MLRFVVLSSALLMATSAFAQRNSPQADGFRGLILNQTTAEEASRILGPPVADKTDRLDVAKLSKWLDQNTKKRYFGSSRSRTSAISPRFIYHFSKTS